MTVNPDVQPVSYISEGEGPAVLVLVPERNLDGDALGVVSHYLAEEAGFHVVRLAAADAEATLNDRVQDVLAVLDELGLDHAWIGGHGFGGTVAREFAAEHHERVGGLLLLGVEEELIELPPVMPVLIVQGADDDITPPANGDHLRATAPERVSVTNIAGAGHLFPLTHIMQTAVVIEEYLDWD